jgi:hypothetical protein
MLLEDVKYLMIVIKYKRIACQIIMYIKKQNIHKVNEKGKTKYYPNV